jgi:hypothetical protein
MIDRAGPATDIVYERFVGGNIRSRQQFRVYAIGKRSGGGHLAHDLAGRQHLGDIILMGKRIGGDARRLRRIG